MRKRETLMVDVKQELTEGSTEEFGELIRFTLTGFVGGLVLGAVLDYFGFSRSAIGQWLVRTISGEGESLLEGYRRQGAWADASDGSDLIDPIDRVDGNDPIEQWGGWATDYVNPNSFRITPALCLK